MSNLATKNLTPDAQLYLRQREHPITPFIIGGRDLRTNKDYPKFWAFMDSQAAASVWHQLQTIEIR